MSNYLKYKGLKYRRVDMAMCDSLKAVYSRSIQKALIEVESAKKDTLFVAEDRNFDAEEKEAFNKLLQVNEKGQRKLDEAIKVLKEAMSIYAEFDKLSVYYNKKLRW